MSDHRARANLFDILKVILRSRGISYRQLGAQLGLSEVTIKRVFQEEDCKLSRLVDICGQLGMTLDELTELGKQADTPVSELSLSTEQALSVNTGLAFFFMLLIGQFSVADIARLYQLSDADTYLYLRELEKLALIELGPDNSVVFKVSLPIRWRMDGPLHVFLVSVNQRFIADTFSNSSDPSVTFYTTSRLLSDQSRDELGRELDELYKRFQKQATLDQLYYPPDQLRPMKLVAGLAPFDLTRYFVVPGFGN